MMKSETTAIRRFNRFGRVALKQVLIRIYERADKRMRDSTDYTASADCWIATNTAHQWLTNTEKSVAHSIQIALMVCVNPAEEARERNRIRILKRRLQRGVPKSN